MERPNVLFIMSDSLSPHYMGAYGDVCGATPNLDKLAQNGVVFDNAYCNSPLCTPSRASMVTGRYVSELGCYDNANEFASDFPSMAHVFRRAGYETALSGKMHFIGHDQYHGFDLRMAQETDYSTRYDPACYRIAYDWSWPSAGNSPPTGRGWMGGSYVRDGQWDNYTLHYDRDVAIHKEAVKYLSSKKEGCEPFFFCASYHHPHNPFYIPENIREKFKGKDLPIPSVPGDMRKRYGVMEGWLNDFHYQPEYFERMMDKENLQWLYETYFGMTYDMDSNAGELLDILDANGLRDNTIVVFTSDHGDMLAQRGMLQKRVFYERAVRVPMILSYPGRYNGGARVSTNISLLDLLPTFADIAGEPPPEGLPGESLLPAATGGQMDEDRVIFCEYHGEGVHAPCFMAVKGRYKYIYVHGHEELLYDLGKDPEEFENIITDAGYSAIADELQNALFDQFDPDAVARDAINRQRNRRYIYQMCLNENERQKNHA